MYGVTVSSECDLFYFCHWCAIFYVWGDRVQNVTCSTFVTDVQYSMYGVTVSSECDLFYFCHWCAIFYVWGDCEFRMWLVLLVSLMSNILCMGWLWVQNVTCSTLVTDVQYSMYGVTVSSECDLFYFCHWCAIFYVWGDCEFRMWLVLLVSLMCNSLCMGRLWVQNVTCSTFVTDVQYSMYRVTVSSECDLVYLCHWCAIFYVWGDCEFRMWLVLLLSLMCNILCMGWLWVQNVTCSTFVTDVQYSMYGVTVSSECDLFYFCHWCAIVYVWGDCEFRMWLVLLLSLMCNILCMGWLWVQNVTCSTFVTDVQ